MKLNEVSKEIVAVIEATYKLIPEPKYNWQWFGGIIFPKTREFINSLGFQKIDDYMDMSSEGQFYDTAPVRRQYIFYIYNPKLAEQAELVKDFLENLHNHRLEAQPKFVEDLLEFKVDIKVVEDVGL